MSDNIKLGQIITDKAKAQKDAIHIAVAPVQAVWRLTPGEHIGLDKNGFATNDLEDCVGQKFIGIVDPFLKESVRKNDYFWIFLYPQTVTGMRHEWSHPLFDSAKHPLCDAAKEAVKTNQLQKKQILKNFYDSDEKQLDSTRVKIEKSKKWIKEYADQFGLTYDEIMEAAKGCKHGSYITLGVDLDGEVVSNEFWEYYEIVTGEKGGGNFFRCSC